MPKNHINHLGRYKLTFYKLLSRIFLIDNNKPSIYLESLVSLLNVISFIQISTLLWDENIIPAGNQGNASIMNLFSYLRIEVMFSRLGLLKIWIYLVVSELIIILLAFIFLFVYELFGKPISSYLMKVFCLSIGIMSTIFNIPAITTLLHVSYFYFTNKSPGSEYNFALTTELSILCSVGALIHLSTNLIWVIYNFSCRHSCFLGKSYPGIDFLSLLCNYLTIILHIILLDISSHLFYGLSFFIHIIASICYIFYLPYYNRRANFMNSCVHTSVTLMIIIIYISSFASNEYFFLLGTLTLIPTHMIFIYNLIQKREEKIKCFKIDELTSEYQFELLFRFNLEIGTKKKDLIREFSRFSEIFNKKLSDFFFVWQAYYCIDHLNDDRLAFVKLTQIKTSGWTFSGEFEYYKCISLIGDINTKYKDLAQIQCAISLSQIQEQESIFFSDFLTLLQLIPKTSIYSSQLLSQSSQIKLMIQKVSEKYNDFIYKYPEYFGSLTNYPEFVRRIIGNTTKANLLQSQQDYMRNRTIDTNFSGNFGILLISAEYKDTGTILFANQTAIDLLGAHSGHLMGSLIMDYIPKPYNRNHNVYMLRYLMTCTDVHLHFPEEFILLNERGFLIEVYMNVCLASFDHRNMYVLRFKKRERRREIAVIDEYGNILAHSELFGFYVGVHNKYLENVCITSLVDFDLEKLKSEKFLIYNLKRLTVAFLLIEIPFRNIPIHLFIISENLNSPFSIDKSIEHKKVFFNSEVIKLNEEEEFCELSDICCDIDSEKLILENKPLKQLSNAEENYEMSYSETLKRKSEVNISNVTSLIEKAETNIAKIDVFESVLSSDQQKLDKCLFIINRRFFILKLLLKISVLYI